MADVINLIVFIVNALHGLLNFYGRDYTQLNLDGLFGLRIIEGQLAHLSAGNYERIPIEIARELDILGKNASKLANMALPHVYEDDPAYFKKFKYLVHSPWALYKEHRHLQSDQRWPRRPVGGSKSDYDLDGCVGERESDDCVSELMEARSSLTEDPEESAADPAKPIGCARITRLCMERMLARKGCRGYSLAHQLLYTMVAELVDCSANLDQYVRESIPTAAAGGVYQLVDEFCTNLHSELTDMIKSPASKRFKSRKFPMDSAKQDLFLEMQFVCGQLGFVEFFRVEWLQWMLEWQTASGCFTNKDEDDTIDSATSSHLPRRQLLLEKDLADDCASHKSAVASGALTQYLRVLLDPGPWTIDHRRMSTPLQIHRFWTPPIHWTYRRRDPDGDRVPLPALPYPARFRDHTFFWFLAVCACFLFVTFRLCRRPNLRTMRWRGLKWS